MTREEIWKDPWFGDQRDAVLALLDRAEKAELKVEAMRHVPGMLRLAYREALAGLFRDGLIDLTHHKRAFDAFDEVVAELTSSEFWRGV